MKFSSDSTPIPIKSKKVAKKLAYLLAEYEFNTIHEDYDKTDKEAWDDLREKYIEKRIPVFYTTEIQDEELEWSEIDIKDILDEEDYKDYKEICKYANNQSSN